jgi:hypothetical protein
MLLKNIWGDAKTMALQDVLIEAVVVPNLHRVPTHSQVAH